MKRLTIERWLAVLLALGLVLLAALMAGLLLGPSQASPGRVFEVLLGADADSALADIVWRIRMPRLVVAMLVGASLSVAGVIFQALLRNPLADPFILGVSGGAALGAIAVLALGTLVGLSADAVPVAAFVGAIAATILLYAVAAVRGRVAPTQLLLTGVVFNAFASAAIIFLASLADSSMARESFSG